MPTFSQRMEELRKKKGLSQRAVAEAVGITSRTYQRYEAGEREAAVSTLIRMADFYDVTVDYLVGRTDSEGM